MNDNAKTNDKNTSDKNTNGKNVGQSRDADAQDEPTLDDPIESTNTTAENLATRHRLWAEFEAVWRFFLILPFFFSYADEDSDSAPRPWYRRLFAVGSGKTARSKSTPAHDDVTLASGSWAFPLVGGLCGLDVGLVLLVLHYGLGLSAAAAAAVALGVAVVINGALHEDGVADTSDALAAQLGRDHEAGERARRDPRIGTAGAAALVLVLLARYDGLWTAAQNSWWHALWVPVAAFAVSRTMLAILMYVDLARQDSDSHRDSIKTMTADPADENITDENIHDENTKPARSSALWAGRPDGMRLAVAIAIALGSMVFAFGLSAPLITALLGAVLAAIIATWLHRKVRGKTLSGDFFGFVTILSECGFWIGYA